MRVESGEWVLLAYRLPREPSTPRITLWRRLRRLGAVQVLDGLVALPRDSRTQERFEWLADEILETGGKASVWFAAPGSVSQERELAQRMSSVVSKEYASVIDEANAVAGSAGARRRTLARLRRTLQAINSRDFFCPPEREQARQAVEELAALVEVAS